MIGQSGVDALPDRHCLIEFDPVGGPFQESHRGGQRLLGQVRQRPPGQLVEVGTGHETGDEHGEGGIQLGLRTTFADRLAPVPVEPAEEQAWRPASVLNSL